MTRNNNTYEGDDRRSEGRSIEDQYSSVEFSLSNMNYVYQFKIWDVSPSGMSILIKEDSEVLKHLEVGEIVDMKYYLKESSKETAFLKTEIRHITKDVPDEIRGHHLVGLSIIKNESKMLHFMKKT